MATTGIPASEAVEKVLGVLHDMPAFITGSAVAASVYNKPDAYCDVDVFVPNQGMYFSTVQKLLGCEHMVASDRFYKMWSRHLRFGFNHWHTNSMKLLDEVTGTEVNVIYKRVDGHETTRLSQVLESFDFGLLGVGYDTETGRFSDMRSYFFGAGADDGRALPMLPYRQDTVGRGFMSQHTMLRTPGRYTRYADTYGYDLSLVKPTLVMGYLAYHEYKADRTKDDDLALASIAKSLAYHIDNDEFDALRDFEKSLPTMDGLDEIMASLE